MSAPSASYPDDLTVREGRQRYFEASGFDTTTYTDRWVKLPVGPTHFYLPNLQARRVCVPLHDVDHVVTGYVADWHGEFEISAFEIGAGCGRYWFGWMVNSQGLVGGALRWPRDCFAAFVRGRRCRHSVFERSGVDETLLDTPLGDLRTELGLDQRTGTATPGERLAYAAVVSIALAVNAGPLVIGALVLWRWLA